MLPHLSYIILDHNYAGSICYVLYRPRYTDSDVLTDCIIIPVVNSMAMWHRFGVWQYGRHLQYGNMAHIWSMAIWHTFGVWQYGTLLEYGNNAHIWSVAIWQTIGVWQNGTHLEYGNMADIWSMEI